MEVGFGVDLVSACRHYLHFLRQVTNHVTLPSISCSLWRYEFLWLPLLQKYPKEQLIPPLDIYWIWHLHMLHPEAYRKDCSRMFNALVLHQYAQTQDNEDDMKKRAREVWILEYDQPYEVSQESSAPQDHQQQTSLTVNFQRAGADIAAMAYQVSLPHFQCEKFLQSGVFRYHKFLTSHASMAHTKPVILSSYDITLVLNAHMVHPGIYMEDCVRVAGFIFSEKHFLYYHTQQSNKSSDLQDGGNVLQSFTLAGTMYRGHNQGDYSADYQHREADIR